MYFGRELTAAEAKVSGLALYWQAVQSCYVLQEPPTVKQGGQAPPEGWPSAGSITYDNVTAAYRPGLPPVLSNLSFTIQVIPVCSVV